MEPLRSGQLRLRVHGPDQNSDEVPAAAFAKQLATLVRALKAADKAVNGNRARHEYKIAKLHSSTPTAVLVERPIDDISPPIFGDKSGIDAFAECVSAILVGETQRALQYGKCASNVAKFGKSGYSEIWTSDDAVFRVDPFLTERARAVVNPDMRVLAPPIVTDQWFKGAAHGSFDGVIKEVDLRGALPQIKLVLSAGSSQIDCVCRSGHIEDIRKNLDRRVRIYGRAIYDGRRGLPRRIEVDTVDAVDGSADLSKWTGAFQPFPPEAWEGDY